jgi:FkbM family methyltransferase
VTLISAPLVHRLAHSITARGVRGADAIWRVAERLHPLVPARLEVGRSSIELDPALPGERLLYRGQWELVERLFLEQHASGGVCFDVGANIGQVTLPLACLAREVFAFEPSPPALNRLVQATNHLSNVRVVPAAVGAAAGTARLHVAGGDSACSTLRAVEPGPLIDVELISLDDFCAAEGIAEVDVLKVDVEGWEAEVFRGAQQLLERGAIRVMLAEVEPRYAPTDWVGQLLELRGYQGFRLARSGVFRHRPRLVSIASPLPAEHAFSLVLTRVHSNRPRRPSYVVSS